MVPFLRRLRLFPHQTGQDAARFFLGGRDDVDPLEVIAVTGVGLDLGLGRGTGERQGRFDDARLVLEFHQPADLAEVGQLVGAEIEHHDAVPEDTGACVHLHGLLGMP